MQWKKLLLLKTDSLLPAFAKQTQLGCFHSTSAAFQKWNNKWNSDVRESQQAAKNYVRYAVRQKRADTKKALKSILLNSGCNFNAKIERDWKTVGQSAWDTDSNDKSNYSKKPSRAKFSSDHARKTHTSKNKRKYKKDYFSDDIDNPESTFHARFENKWHTWSSNFSGDFFRRSAEFDWSQQSHRRSTKWDGDEYESDDHSYTSSTVGSYSDRRTLGLPSTGPINIQDVKDSFRSLALKYHPDKHQGPAQAMAEEKFKQCVNAYQSLCSALSST